VQQPGVDRTCGVPEFAEAGDTAADPQVN